MTMFLSLLLKVCSDDILPFPVFSQVERPPFAKLGSQRALETSEKTYPVMGITRLYLCLSPYTVPNKYIFPSSLQPPVSQRTNSSRISSRSLTNKDAEELRGLRFRIRILRKIYLKSCGASTYARQMAVGSVLHWLYLPRLSSKAQQATHTAFDVLSSNPLNSCTLHGGFSKLGVTFWGVLIIRTLERIRVYIGIPPFRESTAWPA